jgi:hypothetical protein
MPLSLVWLWPFALLIYCQQTSLIDDAFQMPRSGRTVVVEGYMTLTLVSSGDGPALMIRDHLLPLVREHGTLEIQRDVARLIALRKDAWVIEHWTPFNELSRG